MIYLGICYNCVRSAPKTRKGRRVLCHRDTPMENPMPYTDLSDEEKILHAAECVGRGVPIPQQIRTLLGDELIQIIENPGAEHERQQRTD